MPYRPTLRCGQSHNRSPPSCKLTSDRCEAWFGLHAVAFSTVDVSQYGLVLKRSLWLTLTTQQELTPGHPGTAPAHPAVHVKRTLIRHASKACRCQRGTGSRPVLPGCRGPQAHAKLPWPPLQSVTTSSKACPSLLPPRTGSPGVWQNGSPCTFRCLSERRNRCGGHGHWPYAAGCW